MTVKDKIWKYSVEISYSEWTRDKIGYQKSQKFKQICTSDDDQNRVIEKFQKEHDVLIWWIHKWKSRLSISEWFD